MDPTTPDKSESTLVGRAVTTESKFSPRRKIMFLFNAPAPKLLVAEDSSAPRLLVNDPTMPVTIGTPMLVTSEAALPKASAADETTLVGRAVTTENEGNQPSKGR